MKTIYKYQLQIAKRQIVVLRQGAEILTVQMQNGVPCMWALLDPGQPQEERLFTVYGTGHVIDEDPGEYVGTFQTEGGNLVWHLFEDEEKL